MSPLSIQAAQPSPELLELPWELPLEAWPEETVAALPKGISRHIVRFVHLGDHIVAVKETTEELARTEYDLLKGLGRLEAPAVEPVAIVSDRRGADGQSLPPALVTRHLKFSLPYRAVFSHTLRPQTATRLVDAMALLLVKLHLEGFYWGDVSLSNTLFRRDAGAFAAYLVDAETGALHSAGLSDGQRESDLEIARVNVAGELLDLQAGGRLDPEIDPVEMAGSIVESYRSLWEALTSQETFDRSERWRIRERIEKLNALGFDIEELSMASDESGTTLSIQPKVVDSGHHQRRLIRLTGIDAGENQARQLLNDLDSYRATFYPDQVVDEEMVAHEWLTRVFEPVVRAIPRDLRTKLEPAEVFYQLLHHRARLSKAQDRDVSLAEALSVYIDEVLSHRRDEATVMGPPTGAITQPNPTVEINWRDVV
ncbi:lipopolysaccharide kinase [Pontimonas salivibrio]|uniref:Lipopolysaccharide kinase n=1 Tax=Pontimonas salivibrio TaxID=1159327 RepID=A0A2L2BSK8_9MICO|nr:DUF4032 domain-containing protein [Pontimonas salivibrio]AVG24630.1 lipopolysaccharide kinase [Pontimonas salivibrio]